MMIARVTTVGVFVLAIATTTTTTSCKQSGHKIEDLRDALTQDKAQSATQDLPACAEMPPAALSAGEPSARDKGCLAEIATAFGSKRGYVFTPPDQAAAATAAVIVARDHRGDWIAHSSVWLAAMRMGTGPGIDALRIAVANGMVAGVPTITSYKVEDDAASRAFMKSVAAAIPGACPTYWLLGTGTNPTALSPELSAEHSSCVHIDLGSPSGPGAGYGSGVARAAEASLALWRETLLALRKGADRATPSVKTVLVEKLATVDAATIKLPMSLPQTRNPNAYLADLHADAGIFLGVVDAGAPDNGGTSANVDAGTALAPRDAGTKKKPH